MTYSTEQIEELRQEHLKVRAKYEEIVHRYIDRKYKNSEANEHAKHGFARRLKIMSRCVNNVFEKLPPGRTDRPTFEELTDAAINIQAFQINIFGATDNLAWICVFEKELKAKDGREILRSQVGLSKKDGIVRQSFDDTLQAYLNGTSDWFEYIVNYRDALAHRIPLYIPPSIFTSDEAASYQKLEDRKMQAMQNKHFDEFSRLVAEQDLLGIFSPRMTHSFGEKSEPVYFHPQLLADSNTIVELGQKILEELDRK